MIRPTSSGASPRNERRRQRDRNVAGTRPDVRDHDHQAVGGRFFKRLEQCVCRVPVHLVRRVDDGYTPPPFRGRHGEERNEVAHVVHHDFLAPSVALDVEATLHHPEIGVRAGSDPAKHRVFLPDRQAVRLSERPFPAVGEDEARESIGESRLANASRASDQPGMGETVPVPGREQFRLRLGMAEQIRIFTWIHDIAASAIGHHGYTPNRRAINVMTAS